MILKSLGINSKGNCHILIDNTGECLMLDCGIKFQNILRTGINFSAIKHVLYTHSHSDHVKALPEMRNAGIMCSGYDNAKLGHTYSAGNWKFMPIPMAHSVECVGFLIYNAAEDKSIIYATDTVALPHIKQRKYDMMLLECNWTEEYVIQRAVEDDLFTASNYNDHLSTEALAEWLSDKVPPHLIIITHTSDSNLDREFTEKTISRFCSRLEFAQKGTDICF